MPHLDSGHDPLVNIDPDLNMFHREKDLLDESKAIKTVEYQI